MLLEVLILPAISERAHYILLLTICTCRYIVRTMTTEERFTKIENLLYSLTESQVKAEALTAIRYAQAQERQTKADAEMAELRQSRKPPPRRK